MPHLKKRRRWGKWIVLGVVILAIAGASYGIFKPKKVVPVTAAVVRGVLTNSVIIQGTLTSNRQSLLRPAYRGYVKKIYVRVGQRVKAGQPIISIVEDLQYPGRIFPMRAPYSGLVTAIPITEGAYVTPSTSENSPFLVEIDDLSKVFLSVKALENDVVNLSKGQPVSITVNVRPNQHFKGKVILVSHAPATSQGFFGSDQSFYPVQIRIFKPASFLIPGLTAIGRIITKQLKNVLILPQQFVRYTGGKYYVTMIDGSEREIKTGMETNTQIQILSGLKEGDRVRKVNYFAPLAPKKGKKEQKGPQKKKAPAKSERGAKNKKQK